MGQGSFFLVLFLIYRIR